jgi:glycine oxidase
VRVAVVGGGPIGLASAWRLAQAGLDVTVYDPTPGGGAADVAAGMLAPVSEAHFGEEALLRLNLASIELWPAFAAELEAASGLPVHHRAVGSLVVAFDGDDHAALLELHRYQAELGLDVRRLRARECREFEPMLAPGVRSGLLATQDHAVDPRSLCRALLAACERAGVTVRRERVTALAEVAADTVVLAAGCWSAALADVPVRPVKGQIVTLRGRADRPLITHAVRGMVKGAHAYLVPRVDGRILIGATVEEQGFDMTVTAGGVYELMRDASLLVPGITELELVEVRAGLRPGTPDNAPLIGVHGDVVVATGHYRNGILLTPVTADAVAACVTTGAPTAVARPFSPGRFHGMCPA